MSVHQEWFDLRSLSTSTLRDLAWIVRNRRGKAELAFLAAVRRILAERGV